MAIDWNKPIEVLLVDTNEWLDAKVIDTDFQISRSCSYYILKVSTGSTNILVYASHMGKPADYFLVQSIRNKIIRKSFFIPLYKSKKNFGEEFSWVLGTDNKSYPYIYDDYNLCYKENMTGFGDLCPIIEMILENDIIIGVKFHRGIGEVYAS